MKKLLTIFVLIAVFGTMAYIGHASMGVQPQGHVVTSTSGGGTDDIYDAQVRFGSTGTTGSSFKVVLLSAAGAVLAVSNAGTPVENSVVTVTFTSPYTLASGTSYRRGLIGNGYFYIGADGSGSWDRMTDISNSFASPQDTTPASDTNDLYGYLAISYRNSSGTVIFGSTSGASDVLTAAGADALTYNTEQAY